MAEEGIGEHFVDTFYDAGKAIADTAMGNFDQAGSEFLDMSRDALDTISDGGYSHLVDRMNADTGLDLRQELTDGLQTVGNAVGDGVYDAVQWAEGAAESVGQAATGAYDAASDFVGGVVDDVTSIFD